MRKQQAGNTPGAKYLRGKLPAGRYARRSLVVVITVVMSLVLLAPLLGENGLPVYWQLRGERNQLRRQVEELRQRDTELEQRIDDLLHDPEALERLVRERDGMHGRGEQVYEIVDEIAPAPAP